MVRTMLVFGIGFLLPVVVIVLNLIGILPATTLRRTRGWTVVGIFIFAAVGTPSGDPLTMCLVAVPMWLLYEVAVVIARINDRRKKRRSDEPDYDAIDDDEASAIGGVSGVSAPEPIDRPADIDDTGDVDDTDDPDQR